MAAASGSRHTHARRALGAVRNGLLVLSFAALSADARAQPSGGDCAPPVSSRSGQRSSAEEIATLYRSFECHFARKEYAACLPYLEQACRLTDSPRCLLNLGAVHHALMHCQLARGYYQQYLDRSPYDEDVVAARGALEELRRACPPSDSEADDAAPLPSGAGLPPSDGALQPVVLPLTPSSASVSEREPAARPAREAVAPDTQPGAARSDRVLIWSLLGAGAATLSGTVVLAAYGARAEGDYEARASRLSPAARGEDAELRAIDQRGHRLNQLALGLGVLSGLLAGAGATLWLSERWQGESAGLRLQLYPDGTALSSYAGSF